MAIPDDTVRHGGSRGDVARLDRSVRSLVERYQRLRSENAALRQALEESEQRARALEDERLGVNQRRQDAVKRIGDLVSRIDALDARLASARFE